jgi:hypothetical protein
MRHLIAILFLLFASCVSARSLYWPSVAVDARLDSDGILQVIETQTYDLDGEWNGGERLFNIRTGQSLRLEGVERVDGSRVIALTQGNLDAVDQYALIDGSTLRWRSRLANDPPFQHAKLVYRIRYSLQGILRGQGKEFDLSHDFAFPARPGRIERFTLDLALDDVWFGLSKQHIERQDLQPGESVVVRATLTYRGNSVPSGVVIRPTNWVGWATLALLIVGVGGLLRLFVRSESQVGRIGSLVSIAEIDDAWLLNHVFSRKPEVVGAALHGEAGASEVAALIASLQRENIIKTSVESRFMRKPKLVMSLLGDRESLTGYRSRIVNALFFNNRKNTDTDALRKHYKGRGLNLAAMLQAGITNDLARLPGWTNTMHPVDWQRNMTMLAGGFGVLVLGGFLGGPNSADLASFMGFIGLISMALGSLAARLNSSAVDRLVLRFSLVGLFGGPIVAFVGYYAYYASDFRYSAIELVACVIWAMAIVQHVLNLLRTDEHPKKVTFRRQLLAARRYLKHQLRQATPQLEDQWFPYLIALGLGRNVDRWFRAYGAANTGKTGFEMSSADTSSTSRSSSAATGPISPWTGGGGLSGGAGASGSWAVAAGAIGAGISSPGSSSSSSSGNSSDSSSNSSSGGGGGGGW